MDTKDEKERKETRAARLLGLIFGGFVVLAMAGMLIFDFYGERVTRRGASPPADAAEN